MAWASGRIDAPDDSYCAPESNWPSASQPNDNSPQESKQVNVTRQMFKRIGMNDQELVALLGAHCVGGARPQNSHYDGVWTDTPLMWSNKFYKFLLQKIYSKEPLPNTGKNKKQNSMVFF